MSTVLGTFHINAIAVTPTNAEPKERVSELNALKELSVDRILKSSIRYKNINMNINNPRKTGIYLLNCFICKVL